MTRWVEPPKNIQSTGQTADLDNVEASQEYSPSTETDVESTGYTTLSCLEADAERRGEAGDPGDAVGNALPDHWAFQQYVTQADVDRDPFAIALFDVVAPAGGDLERLRHRVAQTLLQFASPGTVVAYLGQDRFGLLVHQADDVHQWLAPLAHLDTRPIV